MTIDELKQHLETLANRSTWDRDDIDGYAGGNIDDAYDGGRRDGETELARELLKMLGATK